MQTAYKLAFSLLLSCPWVAEAGSLWRSPANDERGFYARQVASRPGDLVTVIISENAELSTLGTATVTSGQTSGLQSELVRLAEGAFPKALKVGENAEGTPVRVNLSQLLSGAYNGGTGSVTSKYSVARYPLTVHVTDRLPNGDLVIEGAKMVKIGGESAFAVLRGVIRGQDIDNNNEIPSSRVASASIQFYGEGALSDVQTKGWLTRLLDSVNPF